MNIFFLLFLWLFKLSHFTFILLNKKVKLLHLRFLVLNCQWLLWATVKIQLGPYIFRVCLIIIRGWASVCARLRWWVSVHLIVLKLACILIFTLIEGFVLEFLIELRTVYLLIFMVLFFMLVLVVRLICVHIINI
jgi:hypothetical protein